MKNTEDYDEQIWQHEVENRGKDRRSGRTSSGEQENRTAYDYSPSGKAFPTDSGGRTLKDRFALKLTLAILLLLLSPLFGLLAIVFTCLQHSAYTQGKWKEFRKRKAPATVFLILEYFTGFALVGFVIAIVLYAYSNENLYRAIEEELLSDNGSISAILEEVDDIEYLELADSHSFTYNGMEFELPAQASEILETYDLYAEDHVSSETIDSLDYENIYFGTDYESCMFVENPGDEEIDITDGIVNGFYFSLCEGDSFSWAGRITENTGAEDAAELLGEPTYEYEDSDDWLYCEWYMEDGWIQLIYIDDRLSSVYYELYFE